MKVEYSGNNSGGSWWLKDEDWEKLEKAGWKVKWKQDEGDIESTSAREADAVTPGSPPLAPKKTKRWLGALATNAELECETPGDAIRSFEEVTGQRASDEGCNCCGAPHSFRWGGDETGIPRGYVSGEDCTAYLVEGGEELAGLSRRELIERLAKKE